MDSRTPFPLFVVLGSVGRRMNWGITTVSIVRDLYDMQHSRNPSRTPGELESGRWTVGGARNRDGGWRSRSSGDVVELGASGA